MYGISMEQALRVREKQAITSSVLIHDFDNLQEECLEKLKDAGQQSQFRDLNWAISKGYTPCSFCIRRP